MMHIIREKKRNARKKKNQRVKPVDIGAFTESLLLSYSVSSDNCLNTLGGAFTAQNAYDELKKFTRIYSGEDKLSFREHAKKTFVVWGGIKLLEFLPYFSN